MATGVAIDCGGAGVVPPRLGLRGRGRPDWRQARLAAHACVGPGDRRPNNQRAEAQCRRDCATEYLLASHPDAENKCPKSDRNASIAQ